MNKLQGEEATDFLTDLQTALKQGDITKFVELMNPRGDQDAKFEKAMAFLEKTRVLRKENGCHQEKLQKSGTLEDAKQYLMVIADVAHAAAEVEEQFGTESQTAIALMDKVVDELVATPLKDLTILSRHSSRSWANYLPPATTGNTSDPTHKSEKQH